MKRSHHPEFLGGRVMATLDGTATSCGCGIDGAADIGISAIVLFLARICMMGLPAHLSETRDNVNDAPLRSTPRAPRPSVVAPRAPHFGRCNAPWPVTNRE